MSDSKREVKRINPRRPSRIGPNGLRRIVLGDTSRCDASSAPSATRTPGAKPLRTSSEAASWHIAIAHADRGSLDDHARQAIAAAAILASPSTGVLALVLGSFNGDAASLGADRVAVLSEFDEIYDPDLAVKICAELIADHGARHVFIADKRDGDGDLGRRLIADQGGAWAANVAELGSDHVSIRWSAGAELARRELPRFVLISPGAVDSDLPFRGKGELIDTVMVSRADVAPSRIRDLGIEIVDAANVALEEADFIVSAGNGVPRIATLQALARELGAAVGASRVVVDDGKLPRNLQIGATGKTVSATTYLAVGISGAVQHLQGIKDCRHVVAINRDAGAPIVQRANLAIIGDADEIMNAMLSIIRAERGQTRSTEAA